MGSRRSGLVNHMTACSCWARVSLSAKEDRIWSKTGNEPAMYATRRFPRGANTSATACPPLPLKSSGPSAIRFNSDLDAERGRDYLDGHLHNVRAFDGCCTGKKRSELKARPPARWMAAPRPGSGPHGPEAAETGGELATGEPDSGPWERLAP